MSHVSEIAKHWLGLCPKAPVFRASETGIVSQPDPAYEGSPDGGGGGSGAIRRGAGAALSGTKTLIHNPHLLWFSLLIGLVLAANLIAQSLLNLMYVNREPNVVVWHVLTFMIELGTVFCLVFLLASLVLSVSSKKDRPVSFVHGLAMARKYLKPLATWSVVMALTGTLLFNAGMSMSSLMPYSFNIFENFQLILSHVLIQFPFNWTLNPGVFIIHPMIEGTLTLPEMMGEMMWISYVDTLTFFAINILLFLLTLFVVPLIVLEKKSLKEAVLGSCTMMRKVWGEVAACVFCLGTIVCAAFLMYLLFNMAHAMVTPPLEITWRPTDAWLAAGVLYDLALSSLAFVAATIGGIAALDLYDFAKTGQMPGPAETIGEAS
jgi:hypothetical protein